MLGSRAPKVEASTREERLAFVHERYVCISNCDACGICALFHGRNPEYALAGYIDGKEELVACVMRYRR